MSPELKINILNYAMDYLFPPTQIYADFSLRNRIKKYFSNLLSLCNSPAEIYYVLPRNLYCVYPSWNLRLCISEDFISKIDSFKETNTETYNLLLELMLTKTLFY